MQIQPSAGAKLRLFMIDEATNTRHSLWGLDRELVLFDHLDRMFSDWPGKGEQLLEGE
jgi:hypothetical protein